MGGPEERVQGAGRRCSAPGGPPSTATQAVRSFRAQLLEGGVCTGPGFEGRRRDEAGASILERRRGARPSPQLQPPHPAPGGRTGQLLQRSRRRGHAASAHGGACGQASRVSVRDRRGWRKEERKTRRNAEGSDRRKEERACLISANDSCCLRGTNPAGLCQEGTFQVPPAVIQLTVLGKGGTKAKAVALLVEN